MIIINYGTSEYFEKSKGNKYYCRTIYSAKRKLTELLKKEEFTSEVIKEILKPLSDYIYYEKRNYSGITRQLPKLKYKTYSVNYKDLYIGLSEIDFILNNKNNYEKFKRIVF